MQWAPDGNGLAPQPSASENLLAAASLQEEANAHAAALAGPSAGMAGALHGKQAALPVPDSRKVLRLWEPRMLVLIFHPLQCPICLKGKCWQTVKSHRPPSRTLDQTAVRPCSFWTDSGRCCPSAAPQTTAWCPSRRVAATARAGTCRPGTGHEPEDG